MPLWRTTSNFGGGFGGSCSNCHHFFACCNYGISQHDIATEIRYKFDFLNFHQFPPTISELDLQLHAATKMQMRSGKGRIRRPGRDFPSWATCVMSRVHGVHANRLKSKMYLHVFAWKLHLLWTSWDFWLSFPCTVTARDRLAHMKAIQRT
jgi:hypothetical protein